jgi:hypothetical protein
MFCNYCGTKLREEAKFCTKCGKAVVRVEQAVVENPKQPVKEIITQPITKTEIVVAENRNIENSNADVVSKELKELLTTPKDVSSSLSENSTVPKDKKEDEEQTASKSAQIVASEDKLTMETQASNEIKTDFSSDSKTIATEDSGNSETDNTKKPVTRNYWKIATICACFAVVLVSVISAIYIFKPKEPEETIIDYNEITNSNPSTATTTASVQRAETTTTNEFVTQSPVQLNFLSPDAIDNSFMYSFKDNEISYRIIDDKVNVITKNGIFITNIDFSGHEGYSFISNDAGTAGVFEMHDSTGRSKIYHVTESSTTLISENPLCYVMSADGSTVLHFVENVTADKIDGKADMYIFNSTTGNTYYDSIDYDTYDGKPTAPLSHIAISPDGGTIAFTITNWYTFSCETYVVTPTDFYLLGNDIIPIAISNNGDYAYYKKDNDPYSSDPYYSHTFSLYVQKGNPNKYSPLLLSGNIGSYLTMTFNNDLSETMFSESVTNSDISITRHFYNDQIIAYDENINVIIPNGISNFYGDAYSTGVQYSILGIDSFVRKFYSSDDIMDFMTDYFYLDDNIMLEALDDNGDRYIYDLNSNGTRLKYLKDGTIHEACLTDKGIEKNAIINDNILNFVTADDGLSLYYLKENGILNYADNDGIKNASSNLDYFYRYQMFSGDKFFYTDNGDLYRCEDGVATYITRFMGNSFNITSSKYSVQVETYTDYSEDYYYSYDGKTFEHIDNYTW